MARLAFITPAFRRYPTSEVVFRHRHKTCDEITAAGHEATAIVVAEDRNLDFAREHGFETVECDNSYLGKRWNVGYQRAGQLGCDFVMPIGSDSIVDPKLILKWLEQVPNPARILFTTTYSVIHQNGRLRLDCHVSRGGGGGMLLPATLMAPLQWRPVQDNISRGCDGSTIRSLSRYREVLMQPCVLHQFAVVALQSEQQITNYDRLNLRWGIGQVKLGKVYSDLEPYYGKETVDEIRALYGRLPVAA